LGAVLNKRVAFGHRTLTFAFGTGQNEAAIKVFQLFFMGFFS